MLADTLQAAVNEHGLSAVIRTLAELADKDATLAEADETIYCGETIAEVNVHVANRLHDAADLAEAGEDAAKEAFDTVLRRRGEEV